MGDLRKLNLEELVSSIIDKDLESCKLTTEIDELEILGLNDQSEIAKLEENIAIAEQNIAETKHKISLVKQRKNTDVTKRKRLESKIRTINTEKSILNRLRSRLEEDAKLQFRNTVEKKFVDVAKEELSTELYQSIFNYAFKLVKENEKQ